MGLLQEEFEEAKDALVSAMPGEFQRMQGEANALGKAVTMITDPRRKTIR